MTSPSHRKTSPSHRTGSLFKPVLKEMTANAKGYWEENGQPFFDHYVLRTTNPSGDKNARPKMSPPTSMKGLDFKVFASTKGNGGIALYASRSYVLKLMRKHNLHWSGIAHEPRTNVKKNCLSVSATQTSVLPVPIFYATRDGQKVKEADEKRIRAVSESTLPQKRKFVPPQETPITEPNSFEAIAIALEGWFPFADHYFSTMLFFHRFESQLQVLQQLPDDTINQMTVYWTCRDSVPTCHLCGLSVSLAFWVLPNNEKKQVDDEGQMLPYLIGCLPCQDKTNPESISGTPTIPAAGICTHDVTVRSYERPVLSTDKSRKVIDNVLLEVRQCQTPTRMILLDYKDCEARLWETLKPATGSEEVFPTSLPFELGDNYDMEKWRKDAAFMTKDDYEKKEMPHFVRDSFKFDQHEYGLSALQREVPTSVEEKLEQTEKKKSKRGKKSCKAQYHSCCGVDKSSAMDRRGKPTT